MVSCMPDSAVTALVLSFRHELCLNAPRLECPKPSRNAPKAKSQCSNREDAMHHFWSECPSDLKKNNRSSVNVSGCFIPHYFHLSPTNTIFIYHFNCIYVDLIKLSLFESLVFNCAAISSKVVRFTYRTSTRSKYNWNAFNNVTKKMLVLYKICSTGTHGDNNIKILTS